MSCTTTVACSSSYDIFFMITAEPRHFLKSHHYVLLIWMTDVVMPFFLEVEYLHEKEIVHIKVLCHAVKMTQVLTSLLQL